jgi:hypothetical protein
LKAGSGGGKAEEMSLDVYLTKVMPCRVFDSNITDNLGKMAMEAGIYQACWRPEEIGITKAAQLIPLLEAGLAILKSDRERFEKFNWPNGWGLYKNFVPWVEEYLTACREYPDADVSVSR